ncbi:polyprenyl diphosphate synthase [Bacteriovorax sp. Seq25_V]|uniref:polyprenyl diphosphate synthase n=1 Tax=Bacteriovorax sp. Seq25_V TaxID=1201288 RepID=UPI000389EF01|nr:polyprenyl diphosphate synthase [Bacteriovorax sp. Seq25_V]EQC44745.1 di-trans,poly-cis-decaprenylcistransferase [Bacteriovorax sp. Seq25_V]
MIDFKVDKIKNVAIVMDGNGRWAKQRAHERVWGHIRGSSIVSNIVEAADDVGLRSLTLYAFSTENWSRPEFEVKTLFKLLKKFLLKERERIITNRIQFKVIGDISKLPPATIKLVKDLEELTESFEGLKLSFAFGYGGRDEIVRAVNKLISEGKEVSEESISKSLYHPEVGDIDLLIRTGGDQRVSNFLLWQIAYAELFFTQTKWPEFSEEEFINILKTVECRERRFGAIEEAESLESTKCLAKSNHSLY